jgi:hypothetical protein
MNPTGYWSKAYIFVSQSLQQLSVKTERNFPEGMVLKCIKLPPGGVQGSVRGFSVGVICHSAHARD